MVWYVARRIKQTGLKLLGMWQHTTPSSTSNTTVSSTPEEFIEPVREGERKLLLEGRNIPQKSKEPSNYNHSDELEIKGFLDQFPSHPLMLKNDEDDVVK